MAVNQKIPKANNASVKLISNLEDWQGSTGPVDRDLRQVVVQKSCIVGKRIYALQHVADATLVYRGQSGYNASFNKLLPVLHLTGSAGGHTQTFEYAGRPGQWFVGTKPNDLNNNWSSWSKQIARTRIPRHRPIAQNTRVRPRLANLNHAGRSLGIGCAGQQLARVEAAVSPDGRYFLVAYGDSDYNGYFALYHLAAINEALDHALATTGYVDIATVECLQAFKIPHLSGKTGEVGSLQGFAIGGNRGASGAGGLSVYVSSQFASDTAGADRKVIKIPWGAARPDSWELVDLTAAPLDFPGYYSKLEGIQLIAANDVYLTVAYHDKNNKKTYMNKVYEVTWH